jgi:hypothetical protein
VAKLRAEPAVLEMVGGDRIYSSLPSSPVFPCVRVGQVAGGEDRTTWQPSGPIRETLDVELEVWGGTRSVAANLCNYLRAWLGAYLPGLVDGGAVAGLRWTNTQNLPDDDIPTSTGRARPRYIAQAAVTVHHAPPEGPGRREAPQGAQVGPQ